MRFHHILLPLSFLISSQSFAWTSWVGVLEDWPTSAEAKGDPKYEARIRPLFIRIDQNSWQPAPRPGDEKPAAQLPKAFSWDVCFSGRGEGQLTAMLIADGLPTTTPPYILRSEDRAPWRTRRSTDYAGWIPAPVYKPILLISSLNSSCKDPEKWKQAGAEKIKSKVSMMSQELRGRFAEKPPGLLTYEFSDNTVKVFRVWSSPKQGTFVALRTRPNDNTIETFHISPDDKTTYLGRDMLVIDTGDFDGDGSTEVLFKRRADKKDVYELFTKGTIVSQSIWDYP